MYFALRNTDFEKEENKILEQWLLEQTYWKLSLLRLVIEEIEREQGIKDKLGLKTE